MMVTISGLLLVWWIFFHVYPAKTSRELPRQINTNPSKKYKKEQREPGDFQDSLSSLNIDQLPHLRRIGKIPNTPELFDKEVYSCPCQCAQDRCVLVSDSKDNMFKHNTNRDSTFTKKAFDNCKTNQEYLQQIIDKILPDFLECGKATNWNEETFKDGLREETNQLYSADNSEAQSIPKSHSYRFNPKIPSPSERQQNEGFDFITTPQTIEEHVNYKQPLYPPPYEKQQETDKEPKQLYEALIPRIKNMMTVLLEQFAEQLANQVQLHLNEEENKRNTENDDMDNQRAIDLNERKVEHIKNKPKNLKKKNFHQKSKLHITKATKQRDKFKKRKNNTNQSFRRLLNMLTIPKDRNDEKDKVIRNYLPDGLSLSKFKEEDDKYRQIRKYDLQEREDPKFRSKTLEEMPPIKEYEDFENNDDNFIIKNNDEESNFIKSKSSSNQDFYKADSENSAVDYNNRE